MAASADFNKADKGTSCCWAATPRLMVNSIDLPVHQNFTGRHAVTNLLSPALRHPRHQYLPATTKTHHPSERRDHLPEAKLLISLPTVDNTRSPTSWPYRSLICAKSSISPENHGITALSLAAALLLLAQILPQASSVGQAGQFIRTGLYIKLPPGGLQSLSGLVTDILH